MTTTLGVADCCDACGSQAFVQGTRGTLVLLFCGHHGRQYRATLLEQGWVLTDAQGRLFATPGTAQEELPAGVAPATAWI